MCGRFWASLTWEEYRELLDLKGEPPETNFRPNWNTAPTHDVLICSERDGERRIVSLLFDDADAVPLGQEPVLLDGRIVGQTTSAAFGHRVGQPVAVASLDWPAAQAENLQVDIAGRLTTAKPVMGAVFDPKGTRLRD